MDLNRIASRVAGVALDLKGPFDTEIHEVDDQKEIEVSIHITGEEFYKTLAEVGVPEDEIKDLKTGPSTHRFLFVLDWEHTKPEPHWTGGYRISDIDVIAIDDVVLNNPEDKESAAFAIKGDVNKRESEWAQELERRDSIHRDQ